MEDKNNFKEDIDKETDIYYYILSREDIVKYIYDEEKGIFVLREDEEEYVVIREKKINHKHDKTYRNIISNKNDAAYIINQILNVEEENGVKPEELEKYNSSYVTARLENREADVVYKIRDKNIFFLIEQQTKVDYSMPFRIQEYGLEVKKSAIDIKKIKTKGYEIPVVIPIVIYTGRDKWKVSLKINETKDERFRKVDLSKYNLIDINEYKKEDLLKSEHLIDKIFLLEKTEAGEEFIEVLKEVIERTKDEEDRKRLTTIIQTSLREKIGKEKVKKIIEEMKGSEVTMLSSLSRIIDKERAIGVQEGISKGTKQNLRKMVKEMKKNNLPIELIEKITGLTKQEIHNVN
ncbi:MAG: Rpn family recombination-promoting nuclease/putative transposase [Clostridia bacterium]|nr:Rpn family recombination-promoting nuclease/putative transposase [Clostridia bacterium]